MKKILFTFILLFPLVSSAQKEVKHFEITPNGINGYVVIDFPEMTAQEIFKRLKNWSIYEIKDAKLSNFREIKGKILGYELMLPKALYIKAIGLKYYYDLVMDVNYRFKNGRMRIDISNLYLPPAYTNDPVEIDNKTLKLRGGLFQLSIYKKNGKIKNQGEDAKMGIEKSLKNFVNMVKQGVLHPDSKSDW